MEQLTQLLKDLERITFQDISEIPHEEHVIAAQIEALQDRLCKVAKDRAH
ncbi:hypothetical protein [Marinomonas fungiae]|uniref:Uncharacterized protein n=1 Tax=Marinomonas fungiae TaxID=1137284 RepID=A0A0K6ILM4_9GAMM|nr:hypothetical protein [Marinomonas fungiae]CUB04015.1 hypothetical protein Ga0061065_105107 [Marinomonas fungiae]